MIIENKGKYIQDFEALSWTLKARATKKEKRDNLERLLIDENFAVCTNGHRLHMAELMAEYEPGVYDVIAANAKMIIIEPCKDKDVIYPKYERIFSQWNPKLKRAYNGTDNGKYLFSHDIFTKLESRPINIDYLNDAYCGYSDVSFAISKGNKMDTVTMYNETLNRCAMFASLTD